MGKYILKFLAILSPVLLVILLPWLISFAKPEWRDSSFPTIWTIVICTIIFIAFMATAIYGAVSNMDLTKTKPFIWLFGK